MDYRSEIERLAAWSSENNLALNILKKKDLVVNFQRNATAPVNLVISGISVERIDKIKFLGLCVAEDLFWTSNIIMLKQQQFYLLRILRKKNLQRELLSLLSVFAYCITV